jgi:hypothetical protein
VVDFGFGQQHPAEDTWQADILAIKQLFVIIDTHTPPPSFLTPPPCTCLQAVEAPALAVMVPLLVKGLRESTAIQRKSCVIITNMSKLVNSPVEAMNFLPK